MAGPAPANYKSELAPDKPAVQAPPRAEDLAVVEEFLHLLARAVRQFHTYPATSPMCTDAVSACHAVLASLDHRERIVVRVTPRELIVDETAFGSGTVVEQELAKRLHRARVIALDFDRNAVARQLTLWCSNLVRCDELGKSKTTFAELLIEHGVDAIVPQMAHRPEVLDVGVAPAPVRDLVGHEQRRRAKALSSGGPIDYLYPPDKGWVRLDPATQLDAVSLIDLAILVDDPAQMATMLMRLTDDDPGDVAGGATPLERKFSDVTMLFSSLDPSLARLMFGKLARAVLELAPERRSDLLRRSILPGLLDGRSEGTVLKDFPDLDLADALCLLLELETASPEVLNAALHRLDLPADRRQSMVPLIDSRLRRETDTVGAEPAKEREIDRLARRLIKVESTPGKDFSEFAAFDLSMDDHAEAVLTAARDTIAAPDTPATHLGFLLNLIRIEPNPRLVDTFLRQTLAKLGDLDREGRQIELAQWASRYRQLAEALRESRVDVADAITRGLAGFYGPARALALVNLYENGDSRPMATALIDAFDITVVPGLVALLDDPKQETRSPAIVALMCANATLLAPALVGLLGPASRTRAIIKVLGYAGAGHEDLIAEQFGRGDGPTAREALRALARIGTTHAAALVARQVQDGSVTNRAAAEEALWHFPEGRAANQVRQLLKSRDFVVKHPDSAGRLLARAAHAGTRGLEDVLAQLESLRFRFWNPSLVRVALKARELRLQ